MLCSIDRTLIGDKNIRLIDSLLNKFFIYSILFLIAFHIFGSSYIDIISLDVQGEFSEKKESFVSNEVIVAYHEQKLAQGIHNLVKAKGGKIIKTFAELKAVKIEMSEELLPNFIEDMRGDTRVRYIERNYRIKAALSPDDPLWSDQWGSLKIRLDQAWDIKIGNPSILVSVIDTGTDNTHPDLSDNYIETGYDWVNDDIFPIDDNGHGTHCSGIIAATINNIEGIAGTAQISLMAEKALDELGSGTYDDIVSAILHSIQQRDVHGYSQLIISMSLEGMYHSDILSDACHYAYDNGALIFAAAGNENTNQVGYPAGFYDVVIGVGATDQNDEKASFSNYGFPNVEVTAPGVNILSSVPYSIYGEYYRYSDGTSMSTPYAAGVAALIWSAFDTYTNQEVRQCLRKSSMDIGDPGWDPIYGWGRVDAYNAIQGLSIHDVVIPWIEINNLISFTAEINTITVWIENWGTSDEANLQVRLFYEGIEVDSQIVPTLLSGTKEILFFSFSPSTSGSKRVEVTVDPVSGESIIFNNRLWFDLLVSPKCDVLLISDDNGWDFFIPGTSVVTFQSILDSNGISYVVWNQRDLGYTKFGDLMKFDLVIWSCGNYYNMAVDSWDAFNLQNYLESGGSILLEGEDIGYTHEDDWFMWEVAHANYVTDRVASTGIHITDPTHPISTGLSEFMFWRQSPPYEDGVVTWNGGLEVYAYAPADSHGAIVAHGSGIDRTIVYLAYPLSSMELIDAEYLIMNILSWLTEGPSYHYTYISNIQDDLEIIGFIGLINTGQSQCTLTIDFFDLNGNIVGSETLTLGPYAHYGNYVRNILGSSFSGTIKIIGDQPFVGLYNQRDPLKTVMMSYSFVSTDFPEPADNYIMSIPHVHDDGANWIGFLGLMNVGSSSATVTFEFYDGSGVKVSDRTVSLNSNAHYGNYIRNIQGGYFTGALKIKSDQPFIGSFTQRDPAYNIMCGYDFASEMPAPTSGYVTYVPHVHDDEISWFGFLGVMNAGGSTATVTFQFYDDDGVLIGSKSETLDSYAHYGNFVRNIVGSPFSGSVKISSTQPIVGSLSHRNPSKTIMIAYCIESEMPAPATGFDAYIPHVHDDATSWNCYLSLANTGDTSASVTFEFYNDDGLKVDEETVSVGSRAEFSSLVRSILEPDVYFVGSVKIVSDQPFTGCVTHRNPSDTVMMGYNYNSN